MMVSPTQHAAIVSLLRKSLQRPGHVVEAGCHEGSTSGVLLDGMRSTDKQLHLYDSFDGLPDSSGCGGQMVASQHRLRAALLQRFEHEPSRLSRVHVHPGWFCDTMPQQLPDEICFGFVDCDLFDSVLQSVPHILERLTGTLVIHDLTHDRWGEQIHAAINQLGLTVTEVCGMAVLNQENPNADQ